LEYFSFSWEKNWNGQILDEKDHGQKNTEIKIRAMNPDPGVYMALKKEAMVFKMAKT